jgi:sulfonate transport system permease protein
MSKIWQATIRARSASLSWALPLGLLVLWQAASALRLFPEQLVVPPRQIMATFWDLAKDGTLFANLKVSLLRVMAGFLIGSAIGLALGAAMGLSEEAEAYLGPFFTALRQVPLYGWIPFLIVLLGVGDGFKVVFVAIGAFYPMAMNTFEGVQHVPVQYVEVARAYGHGRGALLRHVILPAALPSVFTGLRLALSIAWMSSVGAEVMAASSGLGYMISWGRQLMQFDIVMVGVICIGLVGLAMNNLLNPLEAHCLRWRRTYGGRQG